jgi:hypothetical protein
MIRFWLAVFTAICFVPRSPLASPCSCQKVTLKQFASALTGKPQFDLAND